MRCERMELGEPDASGRRKPMPIAGSAFEIETDMVVFAIGTNANPILGQTSGLKLDKRGYIACDDNLAIEVARQLSVRDQLGAHMKDELGIDPLALSQPVQAAWISAGKRWLRRRCCTRRAHTTTAVTRPMLRRAHRVVTVEAPGLSRPGRARS